ncbi:MAG: hypothetical protein H7Z37_15510 [Pyrinomonadaceae bacterium]|nr:hypothetical protein [Pyrinomonadaceae bacterium]
MVARMLFVELPNKEDLKKLSQSLAMLDAILCPEFDLRRSFFDSNWRNGEQLATMKDGSGNEYFTYFNEYGFIIKGFDHESEMSPVNNDEKVWQGVLDEVPKEFESFLQEKAFEVEYTTFCLWRLDSDGVWKTGKIEYPEGDETADDSDWLLFLLDGKPETYQDWAQNYYEEDIDLDTVKQIYAHEPLTEQMVKTLNPNRVIADSKEDIKDIGYPIV